MDLPGPTWSQQPSPPHTSFLVEGPPVSSARGSRSSSSRGRPNTAYTAWGRWHVAHMAASGSKQHRASHAARFHHKRMPSGRKQGYPEHAATPGGQPHQLHVDGVGIGGERGALGQQRQDEPLDLLVGLGQLGQDGLGLGRGRSRGAARQQGLVSGQRMRQRAGPSQNASALFHLHTSAMLCDVCLGLTQAASTTCCFHAALTLAETVRNCGAAVGVAGAWSGRARQAAAAG